VGSAGPAELDGPCGQEGGSKPVGLVREEDGKWIFPFMLWPFDSRNLDFQIEFDMNSKRDEMKMISLFDIMS
jgi:hypothetical protein